MTTTNTLIPDYLDISFNTSKSRLIDLLKANPIFKDVDYEGANVTILIELISYLISLNTYYLNMIAKNQYISTSNMYETTHMLSQLGGYNPMGYRSYSTQLTISLDVTATTMACSASSASELLIVPEWSEVGSSSGITNPLTGNTIKYITTTPTTSFSVSAIASTSGSTYEIDIDAREGYIVRYDYVGADIDDNNQIFVPANTYDYDDDLEDTSETIKVYVNDVKWTRLSDWFEDAETTTTAFMFKYDKYGRYYIEFSNTRDIPTSIDVINVYIIVSSGVNGYMSADLINTPITDLIIKSNGSALSTTCYTVTNSASTIGGSSPETIDEIRDSTIGSLHSQYRSVTKNDYISFLESRADIVQANVWGEQEQNPSGAVQDYNKVYISVIPSEWCDSTITIVPSTGTVPTSAVSFVTTWSDDISEYLKPRKIITVYEEFVVPELLYFSFTIGLKIKTNYTYSDVLQDVKDKITYYFNSYNRSFSEQISFIDISEYVLDTTKTSSDDTFSNIKGLRSLVFRDLKIKVYDGNPGGTTLSIAEPTATTYPRYVEEISEIGGSVDNTLRTVQLGPNQFPMYDSTLSTFIMEI